MPKIQVFDADSTNRLLCEVGDMPLAVPAAPTLLQVLGVERKELPASDLLAFFLAPDGPHGLEDLMLQSVLTALGDDPDQSDWADVSVRREVLTEAGTLIDILVTTNELVLCIENKLFASIDNDLSSYDHHVREGVQGRHGRVRCVLLHLQDLPLSRDLQGFQPLSYQDLITEIERRLGPHVALAEPRYMTLLLDFMRTIRRLTEDEVAAAPEFIDYVRTHEEDIVHLLRQLEAMGPELRRVVDEAHQAAEARIDASGHWHLAQFERGHSAGQLYVSRLYRVPANGRAALLLGLRVRATGWSLRIKPISQTPEAAQSWLNDHGLRTEAIPNERNRLRFKDFQFRWDADPAEVGEAVAERLLALLRAQDLVNI